ncbi:MAG: D-TA family PLP-dependent enzyme [Chitinophagaceae bacterium]|nr:MAG: D-TA family PLP-dependent enzyme [Chitinophagaceae bacterium]
MSNPEVPWYLVDDIQRIDSPALLVYPDRVKRNIAIALEMVGDVNRLRPHVKTHKSQEITNLLLQAGVTRFKCATIAEAEMLGRCKAPDVLLAYQPVGPKIGRLLSLIKSFPATRFSCLLDSEKAAQGLAAAVPKGHCIDVFLDLNVGMNRTGISPQKAAALYATCKQLTGLHVIGLHAYDGHIADADTSMRKQRADEAYSQLVEVKKELADLGYSNPVLVIGGSPTFPVHASRTDVECSPGTFVYWDWSYSEGLPDMAFLPAALVVSRVVSVLSENQFCLDLGHKAVAAENPLLRRVKWLDAGELTPVGHSEEHLVMESAIANKYRVGDMLYGIPFHICPTVALYDTAFVIENALVKEKWQNVARSRTLSL